MLVEKVQNAIERYELIPAGATVLTGLSGGADSVALLVTLLRLAPQMGFSVCAAHLNHGIRGESADGDEGFVRELAEFYGVPLYVERADVPKAAREYSATLETAGRLIRYDFLARAKRALKADLIAVAHHMDDQAESILLHLTRGTGLLGLVGMQPRRDDIIRPLLFTRRAEIEEFLAEEAIAYRTDETNFLRDGTRNRLRLDLIPYVTEHINPAFVSSLCSMGELLLEDEKYLDEQARAALDAARRTGGYDRAELLKLSAPIRSRAIRIALYNAGARSDIERVHVDKVTELLSARTGARLSLPYVEAFVSYELICFGVVERAEAFELPLCLEGVTETPLGSFTAELTEDKAYTTDPFTAYMDMDKIGGDVLSVRTRESGDRFYPTGAPGRKKLKDFFIDRKVPRNERVLPLVCCGSEVFFMPGFGISELVKVDDSTVRVLRLKYTDIKPYKKQKGE